MSETGLPTIAVVPDAMLDADALAVALRHGARSFDLGEIYRHWGRIEDMGARLREALRREGVGRDEVEIHCGTGRIPLVEGVPKLNDGTFFALLSVRYVQKGLLEWDDLFRFDYCWAPELLERQVRAVLARTGLDRFDTLRVQGVDLLWNYFADEEAKRRCVAAFSRLEALCDAGVLRDYGVSLEAPEHFSVPFEQVLSCAEEAANGERPHFVGAYCDVRPGVVEPLQRLVDACCEASVPLALGFDASQVGTSSEVLASQAGVARLHARASSLEDVQALVGARIQQPEKRLEIAQ